MSSGEQAHGSFALAVSRATDYLTLAKPELTLLSVLTAVCGSFLAVTGSFHPGYLLNTFVGTLLVGAGAGTLNQYLERKFDRVMNRTAHRPIPSGRVRPLEALVLGSGESLAGVFYLLQFTNALAASLAAMTLVTYLFLYTPLKRISPFATLVGGVPGALPPVIGWVAVRGEITWEAVLLFGVLFFWQMPHFLSLAWICRDDYKHAGYRLLCVIDTDGGRTGLHILIHSSLVLVISLLPAILGVLPPVYATGALLLGIANLVPALRHLRERSSATARSVFLASLAYLPALLLLMVLTRA